MSDRYDLRAHRDPAFANEADVRGDRRVGAQIDLDDRREPAQPEIGVGSIRPQHKAGLRLAKLPCDLAHLFIRESVGLGHDSGGIAAERAIRERVGEVGASIRGDQTIAFAVIAAAQRATASSVDITFAYTSRRTRTEASCIAGTMAPQASSTNP